MEIIIRSRENGWETERRLELPEDVGLVKSILRTLGDPAKRNALWGRGGARERRKPCPGGRGDRSPDFVTTEAADGPSRIGGEGD